MPLASLFEIDYRRRRRRRSKRRKRRRHKEQGEEEIKRETGIKGQNFLVQSPLHLPTHIVPKQ